MGFHTRASAVVVWLLTISLHSRCELVNNFGDAALRCVLFWALFLPLDRVWSVDAWRRWFRDRDQGGDGASREPTAEYTVCSAATAAIYLQVLLIYWCVCARLLLAHGCTPKDNER